jgi:hypothetical protein
MVQPPLADTTTKFAGSVSCIVTDAATSPVFRTLTVCMTMSPTSDSYADADVETKTPDAAEALLTPINRLPASSNAASSVPRWIADLRRPARYARMRFPSPV